MLVYLKKPSLRNSKQMNENKNKLSKKYLKDKIRKSRSITLYTYTHTHTHLNMHKHEADKKENE